MSLKEKLKILQTIYDIAEKKDYGEESGKIKEITVKVLTDELNRHAHTTIRPRPPQGQKVIH